MQEEHNVFMADASDSSGWSCLPLITCSRVLRTCARHVSYLGMCFEICKLHPEPRPLFSEILAAGCALQALLERDPQPSFAAAFIFCAPPYSSAMASLPLPALRALLRTCQLAGLPEPLLEPVAACLAQRYASLPQAQFQAEVGGLFPHWAARVQSWWDARFLALPRSPEGALASCTCLYWASNHLLLPAAFGFEADSAGPECWARGLGCRQSPLTPPPTCAAVLALAFRQSEWVKGQWPECPAPDELLAQRTALEEYDCLQSTGLKDGFAGHICLLQLWANPEDSWPVQAMGAVLGVLQAHPQDGCIALCACGVLSGIGVEQAGGLALEGACPALVQTLLNAKLPPDSAGMAARCLMLHLRRVTDPSAAAQVAALLVAALAPRLAEVLQALDYPLAQLNACWAVRSLSNYASEKAALVSAGVVAPLVRLLDSPLALTRENAVTALGQLAQGSWPVSAAIVEAGLVPHLLRSIHPQATTNMVRRATLTMRRVLEGGGGAQQHSLAAVQPLLPLLAALLTAAGERGLLLNSLAALGKCSPGQGEAGCEAWGQALLEAGVLPRLTALLGREDSVAGGALCALRCMMRGDYLWRQSLVNEGVLQRIAALLLQPGGSGRTLHYACLAVRLLCCQHFKEVLQAGCVGGLVGLARSELPEVAAAACLALGAACRGANSAQIDWLVDRGVADTLCLNLCLAKDWLEGVVRGLDAVLANSSPPGMYRKRLLEAGLEGALKQCARSIGGSAQRAAREVLQRHFGRGQGAEGGVRGSSGAWMRQMRQAAELQSPTRQAGQQEAVLTVRSDSEMARDM